MEAEGESQPIIENDPMIVAIIGDYWNDQQ